MTEFAERHLCKSQTLRIVDVGARDVNGCFRPLFPGPYWEYIGVDVEAGPNVDVVLDDPYRLAFTTGSVDVVVTGSTLEHVEFFWDLFAEMVRVLACPGFLFLIVPGRGHLHRYPVDCWRFLPDGVRALARRHELTVVDLHEDSNLWGDVSAVLRKDQTP